jgi:hypothetical protein
MAVPESRNELIEAINKNYPLLIKKTDVSSGTKGV